MKTSFIFTESATKLIAGKFLSQEIQSSIYLKDESTKTNTDFLHDIAVYRKKISEQILLNGKKITALEIRIVNELQRLTGKVHA